MDNQAQNITRYLRNEMPPKERMAFEALIQKKETLAREVRFQKDFHGFLGRNKPELETKLSNLGDEFILNQSSNSNKKTWWILVGVLMILAILYFFFLGQETKQTIDSKLPKNENQVIRPDDSVKNNLNKVIKKAPLPTPKEDVPKLTKPKPPIAQLNKTDFEPNPFMEDLMSDNLRTIAREDSTFIFKPEKEALFNLKNKNAFVLKGRTNVLPPYQLIIYSNQNSDIENDIRQFEKSFNGNLEAGKYHFDISENLNLKRGLYYWVLQKEGSQSFLYISRFRVE